MFDPLHDKARPPESSESVGEADGKIEQLLLAGLDHYFQAEYERAIDLWSRVLFLDRNHARARTYIDRARAAAAERLRESEELLHNGAEAFKRGNAGEARVLLSSAVEHGGGRDEALGLLDRLNRLETAAGPAERVTTGGRVDRVRSGRRALAGGARRAPRIRVAPLVVLFLALLAGAYAAVSWDQLETMFVVDRVPPAAGAFPEWRTALPVPSESELVLARAQRLVDEGHAHEALQLLASIQVGDPRKTEADEARASIQADLLAADGRGDEARRAPDASR